MSQLVKLLESDPLIGSISELGLTSEELLLFEIAPEAIAGVLLATLGGVVSASTMHGLRQISGGDESATNEDKFKAHAVANKLSNRAFGNLPEPPPLRQTSTGAEDEKSRFAIDVMGSQEAEEIERIGREQIIDPSDPRSVFFGDESESDPSLETVPLLSEGKSQSSEIRQRRPIGRGLLQADPLIEPVEDEETQRDIIRKAEEKMRQVQNIKARLAGVGAGASALAGGIAGVIKWMTGEGYGPEVIKEVTDTLIDKTGEDKETNQKQNIANIINRGFNPTQQIGQQLAQTKVPMRIFHLPPDTESYSYVELVRQANANYNFNNNLFNTGF
jgi:hypothetical protein